METYLGDCRFFIANLLVLDSSITRGEILHLEQVRQVGSSYLVIKVQNDLIPW